MKLIFALPFFFLLLGCRNNSGKQRPNTNEPTRYSYPSSSSSSARYNESNDNNNDEYSDGTWCADVEYYNPNTGTRHTYNLDVEVENGELVKINWPNGGWLDESHFTGEDISSGECSFRSDKGYRYTVTLSDKGGCGYSDGYRMKRDIEEDVEEGEKENNIISEDDDETNDENY